MNSLEAIFLFGQPSVTMRATINSRGVSKCEACAFFFFCSSNKDMVFKDKSRSNHCPPSWTDLMQRARICLDFSLDTRPCTPKSSACITSPIGAPVNTTGRVWLVHDCSCCSSAKPLLCVKDKSITKMCGR
jgi:hypothetical protein